MKIMPVLAIFYIFITDCLALKEIIIKVPPAVIIGHDATLYCFYDLEGDILYSVKWYHDVKEFYRYNPSSERQKQTFSVRGVHILESKSNATQVVLRHVTKLVSGKFSCEITTDQPGFLTEMRTASMEVVEIPKVQPYISGLKSSYRIGEILRANCTSERSHPAANLTWYINGRRVNDNQVLKYRRDLNTYHTSSYSVIRVTISEEMFRTGKMKIRCSASIYDVYDRSVEKTVGLMELEKKNKSSEESAVKQISNQNSELEKTLIFEEESYFEEASNAMLQVRPNMLIVIMLTALILLSQR